MYLKYDATSATTSVRRMCWNEGWGLHRCTCLCTYHISQAPRHLRVRADNYNRRRSERRLFQLSRDTTRGCTLIFVNSFLQALRISDTSLGSASTIWPTTVEVCDDFLFDVLIIPMAIAHVILVPRMSHMCDCIWQLFSWVRFAIVAIKTWRYLSSTRRDFIDNFGKFQRWNSRRWKKIAQ